MILETLFINGVFQDEDGYDKFYPLSDGPNKKLKLYSPPDFENPKDADSDNTYSITVDVWNQQNYKRSYPFVFHIDDIDEMRSLTTKTTPAV